MRARNKHKLGRGLYLRGHIYWFAIQRNGKRYFITLETTDPAEAVRRAETMRDHIDIESGAPLNAETARIARCNPVKDVKVARTVGRARKDFCTYDLRDRLIREAPTEELRFILFCGFHAGLRFQEIVEARPFWFDLESCYLHLRKTT